MCVNWGKISRDLQVMWFFLHWSGADLPLPLSLSPQRSCSHSTLLSCFRTYSSVNSCRGSIWYQKTSDYFLFCVSKLPCFSFIFEDSFNRIGYWGFLVWTVHCVVLREPLTSLHTWLLSPVNRTERKAHLPWTWLYSFRPWTRAWLVCSLTFFPHLFKTTSGRV